MNKKVWIIGIVAMLLVGIATAALVKNLSTTVTANIGISSPIELAWTIQPPTSAYGGDTITFETTAKNLANRNIDIYNQLTEIHASSGENWVGTEFDAIRVGGVNIPLSCVYYVKTDGTLDAFANIGGYNTNVARIYMDMTASGGSLNCDGTPNKYTHSTLSTATSNVQADLNAAFSPSSYTIKVCYLFDLSGSC